MLSLGAARLRAWLGRTGTTQVELAGRLGVRQPSVASWLAARTLPTEAHRAEIERLSGGEVLGGDWAQPAPPTDLAGMPRAQAEPVPTVTTVPESLRAAGWLPIAEAALLCGRSGRTVYRWEESGRLRCRRVAGRVWVSVSGLAELVGFEPSELARLALDAQANNTP